MRLGPFLTLLVVLAGCGGGTTTVEKTVTAQPEATPPASTATTPAETTSSEASGPITCDVIEAPSNTPCTSQEGYRITVADRTQTLRLPSMRVRLRDTRLVDRVASDYGRTVRAKGKFLLVTLRVTNRTKKPQYFEPIGVQTTILVLGDSTQYFTDSDANAYAAGAFFSMGEPIQPDQTQTGQVIFDLPRSAQRKLTMEGSGILISNFGVGLPDARAFGVIRLWK